MARPEQKLQSVKERQDRYLQGRAKIGTLTAGCRAARVSPHTVYAWRQADQLGGYTAEEFATLEKTAKDQFGDRLEAEAYRRAVEGVRRRKYHNGKTVVDESGKPVIEREYSDTMLAMLMNGHMPEKYSRVRHEHTGRDGGPIDYRILSAGEVDRRLIADGLLPGRQPDTGAGPHD